MPVPMAEADLLTRTIADSIHGPYGSRLGMRVVDVDEGVSHLALPYAEQNTNRGGNLHGGAIASALVCGGAIAAASTQHENATGQGRVLSVAISYLSALRDGDLRVAASCLRRGKDTAHVRVDAADESGRSAATALLVYRFESNESPDRIDGIPSLDREARDALERAPSRRMSGSPYGTASGIEVVREQPDGAGARIALEGNERCPGAIHEGAIAGLIDNCGAISSYSCSGVGYDKPGATVGMHVTFCEDHAGALIGFSRLVARLGTSFTNQVEVWSLGSHRLAAVATVSYRILGERRPRRNVG